MQNVYSHDWEGRVFSFGFQEAGKGVGYGKNGWGVEGEVEERRGEVDQKRMVTNILGSHGHHEEHFRPLWGGLGVGKLPSFSKHVRDVAFSRGTGTHGSRRQHS